MWHEADATCLTFAATAAAQQQRVRLGYGVVTTYAVKWNWKKMEILINKKFYIVKFFNSVPRNHVAGIAMTLQSVMQKHATRWHKSMQKKWIQAAKGSDAPMAAEINKAKIDCQVIRAICHTQVGKVKIGTKKAHIKEIQINGGTVEKKVDFVTGFFEQEVKVADFFNQEDMNDVVGVCKGHGYIGVITRWGCCRLVRKSHRGLRKVACIGTWHPARMQFQVPRAGQRGYHHRTEISKNIYRIGKALKDDPHGGMTENDLTEKGISPMGCFSHYGQVTNEWVMLKGGIVGPRKCLVTLRKSLIPQTFRKSGEKIALKSIGTSS